MSKTDSNVVPIRPRGGKKPAPRKVVAELLEQALGTGVRGPLRDSLKAALDIATATKTRELMSQQYSDLKPGEKLLDPTRPGFLARANRRGVRFIYRHRDHETGKQAEACIGYLGELDLAEAREEWERMRAARMRGEAPTRTVSDDAASDVPTIRELGNWFLDTYASVIKRSWQGDENLLKRYVYPEYGDVPADQFNADMATELLGELADTPRQQQKVRAVLSTAFNVGAGRTKKMTIKEPKLARGFRNPIQDVAVVEHEPTVHEPTMAEIRRYAKGLRKGALRADVAQALELQLLTASRIREVTEMRWDEVDLDEGEWVLPAERSKNGERHVVFLSAPALAILVARKEAATSLFVFPGARDKPLRPDVVQHVLADNRKALGVADGFTSHNVRHAFTTWAAENNYAVEIVNRCTAHVIASGINKRYNQAKLNAPARELWTAWAEFLR